MPAEINLAVSQTFLSRPKDVPPPPPSYSSGAWGFLSVDCFNWCFSSEGRMLFPFILMFSVTCFSITLDISQLPLFAMSPRLLRGIWGLSLIKVWKKAADFWKDEHALKEMTHTNTNTPPKHHIPHLEVPYQYIYIYISASACSVRTAKEKKMLEDFSILSPICHIRAMCEVKMCSIYYYYIIWGLPSVAEGWTVQLWKEIASAQDTKYTLKVIIARLRVATNLTASWSVSLVETIWK